MCTRRSDIEAREVPSQMTARTRYVRSRSDFLIPQNKSAKSTVLFSIRMASWILYNSIVDQRYIINLNNLIFILSPLIWSIYIYLISFLFKLIKHMDKIFSFDIKFEFTYYIRENISLVWDIQNTNVPGITHSPRAHENANAFVNVALHWGEREHVQNCVRPRIFARYASSVARFTDYLSLSFNHVVVMLHA